MFVDLCQYHSLTNSRILHVSQLMANSVSHNRDFLISVVLSCDFTVEWLFLRLQCVKKQMAENKNSDNSNSATMQVYVQYVFSCVCMIMLRLLTKVMCSF